MTLAESPVVNARRGATGQDPTHSFGWQQTDIATRRSGKVIARMVIIVDDPLHRAGIRSIMAAHPRIEVVGDFDSPHTAFQGAAGSSPDVVLVGSVYLDENLRSALTYLNSAPGEGGPMVIALLRPDNKAALRNAVRCAARGFVDANTSHEDLGRAVIEVVSGRTYLSSAIAEVLVGWTATWITREPTQAVNLAELTERERQVLISLGEGITNTQIARRLLIREATVRSHIYHIMTKLQLSTRTEAVLVGHRYALNRIVA